MQHVRGTVLDQDDERIDEIAFYESNNLSINIIKVINA